MTEIEKVSADEITPDSHNANAHTERGEGMVDHSLGKFYMTLLALPVVYGIRAWDKKRGLAPA